MVPDETIFQAIASKRISEGLSSAVDELVAYLRQSKRYRELFER